MTPALRLHGDGSRLHLRISRYPKNRQLSVQESGVRSCTYVLHGDMLGDVDINNAVTLANSPSNVILDDIGLSIS